MSNKARDARKLRRLMTAELRKSDFINELNKSFEYFLMNGLLITRKTADGKERVIYPNIKTD